MRNLQIFKATSLIAGVMLGIGIAAGGLAYAVAGSHFRFEYRSEGDRQVCGRPASSNIERRLSWGSYDTIDLALPARVFFRQRSGTEGILRGPSDVIAKVALQGDRLTLNCSPGGAVDLEVMLPGQIFRHVSLSGAGSLVMENLNQPQLGVRIGGSASLRADGNVGRLPIDISGSGSAHLRDVALRDLAANISGSGSVEAAPKDQANTRISRSGVVRVLRRPLRQQSQISGSGRIIEGAR